MLSKEKISIIAKIVDRADKMNILQFGRVSLLMDLEIATEQFDLRLDDFLNADDFNFVHDISGIQNNIDRETKIISRFLPRFAGNKEGDNET